MPLKDFEGDAELKQSVISFLEEILSSPNLLPTEYRSAAAILSVLLSSSSYSEDRQSIRQTSVNLAVLLAPPEVTVPSDALFIVGLRVWLIEVIGSRAILRIFEVQGTNLNLG